MAQIKKLTLKSGAVKYRIVVDIGRDPETGKRQQKTYTYDRKKDAEAELSRITSERAQGSYVRPSKQTLNQHLDEWLPPIERELAPSSVRNYRDALRPVRERLGDKQLQAITKHDVEQLKTWMLTSGRRRGGKAGSGLSGRTVGLTLGRFTSALDSAVAEGKIARNVASLVKPPKHEKRERETWSEDQVRAFLTEVTGDRLHAAWRMSLYGLRRGEVLGLQWHRVQWGSFGERCAEHQEKWCKPCYNFGGDYRPATIAVEWTRVLVDYRVVEKPPKSKKGKRTLPLDAEVAAALRALWVRQASERLEAGEAYTDTGWVVVNEIGEPVNPEWYSDEFDRVRTRAGLPRIVLHGARHTALSLMVKQGVAISIVSAWAGHHDPGFTLSNYVHTNDEDMSEGADTLGRIYKVN